MSEASEQAALQFQLNLATLDAQPAEIEPVELELLQHHAYKSKGKGKRGCASCTEAKTHPTHIGAPPSLSVMDTNGAWVYSAYKKAWTALLFEQLQQTGLPQGLEHVLVEGECTFPDRRRRDQGNHRFMVEKAMGDALTTGGYLEDDDWSRYEFGGLAQRYEKGVSRTRLLVFPR
jgi:hypothetical protein